MGNLAPLPPPCDGGTERERSLPSGEVDFSETVEDERMRSECSFSLPPRPPKFLQQEGARKDCSLQKSPFTAAHGPAVGELSHTEGCQEEVPCHGLLGVTVVAGTKTENEPL